MSSEDFVSIGPGKVLAYLRGEVRAARKSFLLVGPWIDDYVAEELTGAASRDLHARILVRPKEQVDPNTWIRMSAGLSVFSNYWGAFEARALPYLHAKLICIDDDIVYLGSANWYRFSLEKSLETVIRGRLNRIQGLQSELELLWDQGTKVEVAVTQKRDPEKNSAIGILHEVVDPIAAKALRENPKAFHLGKKRR
jgi:hypothetical protein